VSLSEAQLLEDVRQRFFSPLQSDEPRTVGVELELIPVIEFTRKPALAAQTSAVLSELARKRSWTEKRNGSDPPSWEFAMEHEFRSSPVASSRSAVARIERRPR